MKKIATGIALLLPLSLAFLFIFSPFQHHDDFDYPLIKSTVIIDAPVNEVFDYLGNSDNARDWSVFVDHITTTNAIEVPDGSIGSERRCFVNADESGTQWDERTTLVIPNRKRQLVIYNLVDFSMTADNLATEQIYTPLENNKCELTFTVFYKDTKPTVGEYLKTKLGAFHIKSIFEDNMNNIKTIIEKNQAIALR